MTGISPGASSSPHDNELFLNATNARGAWHLLLSDLAGPFHDIFVGGQAFKPHRAAGVYFVG